MKEPESNKRALILDSAEEMFSLRGYDTATLDEIASVAGVAKGTIYLYFSSKQELFISLVENRLQQFLALTQARLGKVDVVEEWLKTMIITEVDFIKEHVGLVEPMFHSLATRSPEFQERVLAARQELEVWIAQRFAQLLDGQTTLDPHLTLTMIFGAVNALVVNKLANKEALDANSIAAIVMALVMPSISQRID